MLFNTYLFLFIFLPVSLLGFFLICNSNKPRIAIAWLVGASLFFYAWWNPAYVTLIMISIIFNYLIGCGVSSSINQRLRFILLASGITVNLLLLGYFKYANFFVENLSLLMGKTASLQNIVLPLGISFFTFTQIAYLVDSYRHKTDTYRLLDYCLFVTFFPHLIAGPILHHREIMPQFAANKIFKWSAENISIGSTIFFMGLFKKIVFADGIAAYSNPIFDAAHHGTILTFGEAWCGAIAYSFQLYFDFSGYSDMAIGLARLFGIHFPINFNSPYKAINIIDFWRRWHITLSRFLREYLYIPLGGNRKGKTRRYLNLFITMLLGGLWHGASWTFVIWGALHGIYLVVNHAWQTLCQKLGYSLETSTLVGKTCSCLITFIAVVIAWVFFRADDYQTATSMLRSMLGLNGFSLPSIHLLVDWNSVLIYLSILLMIIWFTPNTQQLMIHYPSSLSLSTRETTNPSLRWITWRPDVSCAFICAIFSIIAILEMKHVSQFIYFQF